MRKRFAKVGKKNNLRENKVYFAQKIWTFR